MLTWSVVVGGKIKAKGLLFGAHLTDTIHSQFYLIGKHENIACTEFPFRIDNGNGGDDDNCCTTRGSILDWHDMSTE